MLCNGLIKIENCLFKKDLLSEIKNKDFYLHGRPLFMQSCLCNQGLGITVILIVVLSSQTQERPVFKEICKKYFRLTNPFSYSQICKM